MSGREAVTVAQADFLDQDPPIRGQRYACISFVSPEDVILRKDAFRFARFVEVLQKDIDNMLTQLSERYADKDDGFVRDMVAGIREAHSYLESPQAMSEEFARFAGANGDSLDRAFAQQEGFQTSVRGFKIRGVYDGVDECKARAKQIKQFDDKFNVYVAEVGCWCPWSPNPDEIADSEYAETHLNTLMQRYKQNADMKDEFYRQRKHNMVEDAVDRVRKVMASRGEIAAPEDADVENAGPSGVASVEAAISSDPDPWMANKALGERP